MLEIGDKCSLARKQRRIDGPWELKEENTRMGEVYEGLDERLTKFIQSQHVFFVGTAPSSLEGHVNVSPKGLESLRILDPKTIAYVDHTGSGAETIAHLRENRRIV